MRETHLVYASAFPISTKHIGKMISKGKQHFVYEYGKNQVVKIPRRSVYNRLYGILDVDVIKADLELLFKYCKPFIPNTEIFEKDDAYIIIQDKIAKPSFVTQSRIQNITPELLTLIHSGKNLYKNHGVFLDIFGYQGMTQSLIALLQLNKTRALMTNILIDYSHDKPKLFLVDTNLSSVPQKTHPANFFHKSIDILTISLTKFLTSWAFDIKM